MPQAVEPEREQYRPRDRDGMRVAARELASRGLRPRDIAAALGLTEAAVRQLLGQREVA